jgi:Tfp pilus assembly protein PilX
MRNSTERGIAMITTLLVLMLMSALLVGFTTMVMSDQRYRFIDRDRGQAFYGAAAGIEKMTSDLGNLFLVNVAPTQADVLALTATAKKPNIANVTFTAATQPGALPASLVTTAYCSQGGKTIPIVGTNGYTIRFCGTAAGKPTTSDNPQTIKTGPYEGLMALQTPYQLDVTARTTTGGEVHLIRTVEAVAIPVFQFGMFSDSDLSFFAAQPFGFGGRVHTNGNLWLAEGTGSTLTTTAKVTAVGDVFRQVLSNTESIDNVFMAGTVNMALASGGNRNLLRTEGSRTGGPGSAVYANWQTVSLGASPANYNGFLRNGSTGAKTLSLPLVAPGVGGTNADLIRRPVAGEDTASILFGERLFSKASLRILLSDTSADITNLPTIDLTRTPVQLTGDWKTTMPNNGVAYNGGVGVDATHPPIARSLGPFVPALPAPAINGAIALNAATINVNAAPGIPTNYLNPATLTVGPGAGVAVTGCTGRTLTSFTGCTVAGALTNGWTISATSSMPGNGVVTATLNGAVAAGAGRTLNVNVGQTTWAFAANTFYMTGTNGMQVPVTCSGIGVNQFTTCTGAPAAPDQTQIITAYLSALNNPTIGGFIKIERQDADGSWHDVTMEILNYGIGGPNLDGFACGGGAPADPTPNAIVRLQRLRDNAPGTASCPIFDFKNSYEWVPNVLFDTREGTFRDADPSDWSTAGGIVNAANAGLRLGGAMYYVTVDARNLARWFKASGAPFNTGTGAGVKMDNSGYTLYFSDRRNNRNAFSQETAEYGFEDFVNPGVAGGVPNNLCNLPGEDVNGSNACETYGQFPSFDGVYNTSPLAAPLTAAARPQTLVKRGFLQVNRPVLFRRALKLINGAQLGSDPTVANRIAGLTVVSENPVYIQGDWNAANTFLVNDLHAATAVIADAVTVLSNSWNDTNSFVWPYTASSQLANTGRIRAAQSYYRVAILGGKGPSFNKPADLGAGASVFGTDGGAHNFLRMLEGDNGNQPTVANTTVNYRGSMATLYYNRQGVGTFKCCSGTAEDGIVYSVPVRNFIFDTDFLQPALLPPNTPMFRDMNAVGFSQELRPGK